MSYNYPDEGEELVPGGKWKPPPQPFPNRPDLSMSGVAGQLNPATGNFGAIDPTLIAALRNAQSVQQDQLLFNDAMAKYKPPASAEEPGAGRRGPGDGLRGRIGGGRPGGYRVDRWGQ